MSRRTVGSIASRPTSSRRKTVADGEKQAAILRAEGDRQAAVLRAEGFSLGLGAIAAVGNDLHPRTLQLQYFETLKALGAGAATKIVVPVELTDLVARIGRPTTSPERS
jgi:regulator of protease activity HflC (stomatin/prohibitin superfamily)